MTVLNLEDSKALYEAGITIKTEYVHLIYPGGGSKIIGSGSLCLYYYKNGRVPAPDLEELLEKLKVFVISQKDILRIRFSPTVGWNVKMADSDYEAHNKILLKACADYLLMLKENGYEV